MVKPFWACFYIFLKSNVSEEELGVTVHGGDDIRGGYNVADLIEFVAQGFGSFQTEDGEEVVPDRNAAAGELFEVGALPFVGEVARVIWSEFALEWPVDLIFFVAVLVVVGEAFDRHVADMLADLG